MRFLADMGISQRVVEWLRIHGHDAVHLREQGLQRLPDGEIFHKAADEGRVVLTFDLDFGEIVASCTDHRAGVILFRVNNATTPFVIERLESVLDDAAQALLGGAIVVVEDARHRVRSFPP